MRLILIADSHLAPRAPAFSRNAEAAVDHVRSQAPDLVVHLGDVTLDGAEVDEHFEEAAELFGEVPVPFPAVPGNHDVGDCPPGAGHEEPAYAPDRTERFRLALGPDRWVVRRGGWTLLGLNAPALGSGSDDEHEQWAWLDGELAATDGPVALFLHKPLFDDEPESPGLHPRYVPPEPRRRLLALLAAIDLRLVACGHVHQWRSQRFGPVTHLWVPSVAFVIPDVAQPVIGDKVMGVVELELDDEPTSTLVRPPGLVRHNAIDHPEAGPEVVARWRRLEAAQRSGHAGG